MDNRLTFLIDNDAAVHATWHASNCPRECDQKSFTEFLIASLAFVCEQKKKLIDAEVTRSFQAPFVANITNTGNHACPG